MNFRTIFATSFLAAFTATGSMATSIGMNDFTFSTSTGSGNAETTVTPQSIAGLCDPFDGNGCDGGLDQDGTSYLVDFVDGDSFDIGISGSGQEAFRIDLKDLIFAGGAAISSLAFNLGGGDPLNPFNVEDFLFSPQNNTAPPAPDIDTDFSGDSITLSFSQVSPLLFGDAVAFRFDIGFDDGGNGGGGVSQVPLPAGGLFLLAGIGSVVALRRRKKTAG